jgi:hypothetical protein
MIDFSHNHLKDDIDALLKHIDDAAAYDAGSKARKSALFSAGLRLTRLEKEIARMGDVITQLETAEECSCHRQVARSHELCCGHDEGRDPNCPFHGDGSTS